MRWGLIVASLGVAPSEASSSTTAVNQFDPLRKDFYRENFLALFGGKSMGRWSMNELKRISDEYTKLMKLRGHPVAIKLFKTAAEFEGLKVKRLDKVLAVCQVLAQAHYLGRVRLGTAKELDLCPPGSAMMGLRELPEAWKTGEFYVGMYHTSKEVGRKAVDALPKFKAGETAGILFSPLEKCPVDPDVVLFWGNVAQALMIPRGYLYNKGGSATASTVALCGCLDAVVTPIQTKKPNIALPCNGGRLLGDPDENNLWAAAPGELLEDVLDGIKFTVKAGVTYPTAWQHINLDVPLVLPLAKYVNEE